MNTTVHGDYFCSCRMQSDMPAALQPQVRVTVSDSTEDMILQLPFPLLSNWQWALGEMEFVSEESGVVNVTMRVSQLSSVTAQVSFDDLSLSMERRGMLV